VVESRGAGEALIGRAMPRVEDRALLTGRASFVDDVDLPGALHAVFVRSDVAHGVLREVRVDAARGAPGVVVVVTAADLAGIPDIVTPLEESIFSPPRPLLARERVRFVGEPVAIVVATSRYAGEDAAALVDVDVEPLPAVNDLAGALVDAAPALHEQSGAGNVVFERRLENGDPDEAFASAPVIVERTFRHPRSTASPMEPCGAAAYPEDGGVAIWCSTQGPHNLRRIVTELFGIERVRVRCPDIGGGFGLKGVNYPEEILVGWLALRLQRPVKWVEDRVENLISSTHSRDMEVRVRAAADADGLLQALDVDVTCDTGAYGVYPQGHILEALGVAAMSPGPYRVRNFRGRARSIATNKCPSGPYRGVGLPVATFVHERLMDVLAAEIGVDRAELRRRNFVGADEMPYTTITHQRYDSGDYRAALDAALELIRYDELEEDRRRERERGRLLGLGLSCYVEWTGVNSKMFKARGMTGVNGFDGCHVELDREGTLSVWTTLPAIGQGTATTFAQTATDVIGIDFADIRVRQSDTEKGGIDGTGTFASRSTILGAGAIHVAGTELRRRLLEDASEHFEVAVEDLEISAGRIAVSGSPRHTVSVAELARKAEPERYRVSGQFDSEHVLFPYATHACRVSIDPATGELAIVDYVVAEDIGRVVNHPIAEGQTHGAVAQGIGGAVYEAQRYDDAGQPQTASFMDYLIPSAPEVPHFRIRHLEMPTPDSMFGSKGVGEGGTIAPSGALANAVSDALGVECNTLPLTPERLQRLASEAMTARVS
jgi:carbon-monoxide dehydrogenase large subunit